MAKKATQPTLPGMGPVKRVRKPVDETTVEPKPKGRKNKLGEELKAGNRPMFMTAGEIIRHSNLTDTGEWYGQHAGEPKSPEQKADEKGLMAKKLRESKTGTYFNSHLKKEYQRVSDTVPSLHEKIKEEGYDTDEPITIQEDAFPQSKWNDRGYLERTGPTKYTFSLYDGHHRMAAQRNLNPKQFLPVNFKEDW
jgi:hypothetical protein